MKKRMTLATVFLTLAIMLSVLAASKAAAQEWYHIDWPYRKEIAIDHTKVDADLTDFPVLISLDSDADLASKAQNDGDDILFTDASDNQLNHEIEYFDGATGELVAWVNVPSVSSTTDTILYMYYGNAAATNQENAEGVWDSNYVMVQHFGEISGTHYDSTSNNNDGTPQNGVTQDAVGKINGADEFDGVDDHVDVGTLGSFGSALNSHTISIWLKWDHSDSWESIGGLENNNDQQKYFLFINRRGDTLADSPGDISFYLRENGTDALAGGTVGESYNDGGWHHVVFVISDAPSNDYDIYVDGSSVGTYDNRTESPNTWVDFDRSWVWGARNMTPGGIERHFEGAIDEVRVSDTIRSPGWISTSFSNHNNPSEFYDLGLEETPSAAPTVSNPSPADGATDVPVSLSELSFVLSDAQDDLIDYTVTITPDVIGGAQSDTGVASGTTIHIPIAGALDYDTLYTWQVQATDPAGSGETTTETYTFTTEMGEVYLSDWDYREELTIDHQKVAGDLTDFPVLVDVTRPGLQSYAQSDGDDILFTDSSADWTTDPASVRLAHEIESYDSATGRLIAWVKAPILSSTADTILHMYYGNSAAENQENVEAVWDDDYVMVQHVDETSGTHYDSTSNHNDGTPQNGVIQDTSGIISGADDFDGNDDYVEMPDSASLSSISTIELWFKPAVTYDSSYGSSGSEYDGFISKREASADYDGFAWFFYGGSTTAKRGKIQLTNDPGSGDTSIIVSNRNTWDAGEWYHIAAVLDGVSGKVYVNGVDDTDTTLTTETGSSLANCDESLVIAQHISTYINYLEGVIDEVRLSDTSRSADWILTAYNNQSSPSTFCGFGEPPVVTLVSPADEATADNPVTFEYTPQCFSEGGCDSTELYIGETTYSGDGTLEWSSTDLVKMDRALLRDNKVYAIHWPSSGTEVCTIVVFDFLTGEVLQESPQFGEDNPSTAPTFDPTDPNIVYGVSGDGEVVKYNLSTDSFEWHTDITGGSSLVLWPSSVPYYDGYLYISFRDYKLYQVDASDGSVERFVQLDSGAGGMDIPPRVDREEGVLYVQDASRLRKLNASDLSEIWSVDTGSNCLDISSGGRFIPLLVEDSFTNNEKWIVTHCAPERTTYCFDSSGNQEWVQTLDRSVRAPASYHPDRGWIYLNSWTTSGAGKVYVLDITDGSSVFDISFPNDHPSNRPMMLTKEYLIAKTDRGSATDYLYVFDNSNGDLIGTIDIGTQTYMCDPMITSAGYTLLTHNYGSVRLYRLGSGEYSDYTRYTGDNGYQYTENGLTNYGQPTEVWTSKATNPIPIVNNAVNSIEFDFSDYSLPQTFKWNIELTDSNGYSSFAGDYRTLTVEGEPPIVPLNTGWNLISVPRVQSTTAITEVLFSIDGSYDLVYAWDAVAQAWDHYDPGATPHGDLTDLDEKMGFWIHMTEGGTLVVTGTVPTATDINLDSTGAGWNLVGYPSAVNRDLPGVLQDHGVGEDFSFVYAYHANDSANPWKLFDRTAPGWSNDLTYLSPGWGYWVKVSAGHTWSVDYLAP